MTVIERVIAIFGAVSHHEFEPHHGDGTFHKFRLITDYMLYVSEWEPEDGQDSWGATICWPEPLEKQETVFGTNLEGMLEELKSLI